MGDSYMSLLYSGCSVGWDHNAGIAQRRELFTFCSGHSNYLTSEPTSGLHARNYVRRVAAGADSDQAIAFDCQCIDLTRKNTFEIIVIRQSGQGGSIRG